MMTNILYLGLVSGTRITFDRMLRTLQGETHRDYVSIKKTIDKLALAIAPSHTEVITHSDVELIVDTEYQWVRNLILNRYKKPWCETEIELVLLLRFYRTQGQILFNVKFILDIINSINYEHNPIQIYGRDSTKLVIRFKDSFDRHVSVMNALQKHDRLLYLTCVFGHEDTLEKARDNYLQRQYDFVARHVLSAHRDPIILKILDSLKKANRHIMSCFLDEEHVTPDPALTIITTAMILEIIKPIIVLETLGKPESADEIRAGLTHQHVTEAGDGSEFF